ncbi:hypothetical protein ACFLT7_04570 [candidate division KSB1 bacterium]
MIQILLFFLFLIAFLYIIGKAGRRTGKAASHGEDRWDSSAETRKIYERESDDEIPGIEWEVTEGEAMLRQLVEHCKENPGETSKLIKSWMVGANDTRSTFE